MLLETYYNCSLDKYGVLSVRKWNETGQREGAVRSWPVSFRLFLSIRFEIDEENHSLISALLNCG